MENLLKNPKSFYNPFIYIAGSKALFLGLFVIVLTGLLGWLSHTWLDGLIDLHHGPQGSLWVHIALGITNWLSMVLVLTPLASWLSPSKVRILDIAGTQALARLPMLIAILTGFLNAPERVGQWAMFTFLQTGDPVVLTPWDWLLASLAILIILLTIVWMVALMFNAWKVSANLKGTRAGISFTIGILVAYILSKITAVYLTGLVL